MATVEHDRITSSDIFQLNDSEEWFGIFDAVSKMVPEIDRIGAAPCTKTQYKTLIQTGLPSVGFRESNVGIKQGKPTITTAEVQCKYFDASWSLDQKVAQECEWGEDAAKALCADSALKAAMQKIAEQTWYGTKADAAGFSGVANLLQYLDSPMVVNAGGTTANKASSIFAIRTELQGVQYAWGQNGSINIGSIIETEQWDSENKKFWAYSQKVTGHVGLQIPSTLVIGRIANITEQDGKGATDELIAQLLEMFPAGRDPNLIFMSKRSLSQLRRSRVGLVNAGKRTITIGAQEPFPDSAFGIPIFVSESIKNTEALLTVTPSENG
ncbi:MAG: hypothetical protein LBC02_04940 [Planctomycetaceae bacterium]|jgi:hypothetical protein|nr:hypothetical protein [Planctomycetaceae bacterium]